MANIDIYYESLKQVHNQILAWGNRPESFREKLSNWLLLATLGILLLSLLPILPTIFVFVGSQQGWVIGSVDFSQATILTYGLAWLISSVVTLIILLVTVNVTDKLRSTSTKNNKPPQSLSPEQMTFIAVYEASKELKFFFVSHIDEHVNNCIRSLREIHSYRYNRLHRVQGGRALSPAEFNMLTSDEYPTMSSLPRQTKIAQEFLQTFEKYPWFSLDDVTKSRLHALISFQKKTSTRLKKRVDLPAVLKILDNLSKFTYAYLPEHQTNMDIETLEKLQAEGTRCLDVFVQEIEKFTYIHVEDHPSSTKENVQKIRWQKLRALYFYNVLFRFILWFIVLLALSTSLVFIASLLFQPLDITVMVSMVIGTTIAGSAALAVFGAKSAESRQDSELQEIQSQDNS